jgi:hypothetical protein
VVDLDDAPAITYTYSGTVGVESLTQINLTGLTGGAKYDLALTFRFVAVNNDTA